jgi:putative SOS response-associated peptidase YedK
MYARLADGSPFAFAGLWERWTSTDGSELDTFTIVTTEPNERLAPIHNRMPAILRPDDEPRWLDASADGPAERVELLRPYPAEAMAVSPVSRRVNRPAHDGPELIEPAESVEKEHQGRLF